MSLDSIYLPGLLALVVVLQRCLPQRGRIFALLTASLAFYALSGVGHLALLAALCGINYLSTRALKEATGEKKRNWIFGATVGVNLAALIAFKYLTAQIAGLLTLAGWHGDSGGALTLAAPLGMSYFTFQMIACVTDVYRRDWEPEGNFTDFALFSFFFPQIVSGPIPRAGRLMPQLLMGGVANHEDVHEGARMIARGFFKKEVVANRLVEYVSVVFGDPGGGNTVPLVLACVFNALQLYADFSGYVDIAIGSARVLGIRLDPNFDHPFTSTSVTEFWRRWHMTLSFWLRDYLYMPLVLRIRELGKTGIVMAIVFTFAVCGIWHAATWPYLLFGLAQGAALSVEVMTKSWFNKRLKRMPGWIVEYSGRIYVMGFFVFSQVLFKSATLSQAFAIYGKLLHPHLGTGLKALIGIGPILFMFQCLALGAWAVVEYSYTRTSERGTPWFVLLCALLIMFLGVLGTGHFIYAAF
jgi:alginate O-acetyltransferase complex protein AlgI